MPHILRRVWGNLWGRRQPLISLVGNLSYRKNLQLSCKAYAAFVRQRGGARLREWREAGTESEAMPI
jgi:hypothetical protein